MKVTRFSRERDLIIVHAQVKGPRDQRVRLSLVVDTGCSNTTIVPEVIDRLGYSPRDGEYISAVRSAIGKEQGYTLRVKAFSALGYTEPDHLIHVFDLATGADIDGLIGLSYLDQFNYEVRSQEGRLRVERAASAS